ncbi:MAG: hypothetical protein AAF798_03240 [Bacteroidota bacterium]
MIRIVIIAALFFLGACQQATTTDTPATTTSPKATATATASKEFGPAKGLDKYWYEGKAEISRYELSQNRYRDVHPGQAVLIFVTEDFLTDKQVKNDNYRNPNSVPILKTNLIRTFPTGIYDYSIMTSVFTPVGKADYPNTLKVTTTAQDWCGHAFMQLNLEEDNYRSTIHSYFENEADQVNKVPIRILEDELFNRVRISPSSLPTGKHEVLPSTVFARLRHIKFQPLPAQLSLTAYTESTFEGQNLQVYTVEYPSLKRTLEIIFEKEAPYEIVGWTDSYPSAFDGQIRTSVAKKTHQVKQAYWSNNALSDMALREKLGLD